MLSRIPLADSLAITTALTASILRTTSGLYGLRELVVEANFTYGSGGTTVDIWIQTSLDGGSTWLDIMQFAFLTTTLRKIHACSLAVMGGASADAALRTNITPTDGTLGDNLIIDGILGDMLRAKITTVGTYAGSTTLSINAHPKG